MKRVWTAVLLVVCCAFVMTGCQSSPQVAPSDLPSWVLMPPEGGISAVGSAKVGPAGMSFAKLEATSNARDEIARSINVKVKNMIKNFTETTGVGDDTTVDKVFTNVSKQVAKVDLTGSQIKNVHLDKANEEIYVLVALQPEAVAGVADAMKQAAVTSYKNDKALWQKFQAKKGHEELDKEIEKEFGSM
ncbi:LPP20 family lipoprotein [Desulfoluna butyratoxydans]|uniref:Lipoprotein lpp20-like n=1 Tax=Desulfoluna butyratoxydans TaxID=231438 RepID=A0A4U8YPW7_9BACT|nr:LPP20 family lipoprotein [Desulfoluna butyratoxydans]VFQ45289.1 lipoprotein lpp20-like [Desulfoluna butyratoxydans]